MKNKKIFYYNLMMASIILFVGTICLFNHTKIIAPILIVICIYLFIGAIIKCCKTSLKLKNTVLWMIDLLFWLP